MNIRRRLRGLGLLLAVAGLLGLCVPAALAVPPTHVRGGPTPDFVIRDSCAFPVLSHDEVNKGVVTFFSNGVIHVTGALKLTLTNLDTGTSIELNISGPGTITETADGGTLVTLRGPSLWFFGPGPGTIPGPPGIILTTGPATILFNPDGSNVFTHTGGTTTDVCALLE